MCDVLFLSFPYDKYTLGGEGGIRSGVPQPPSRLRPHDPGSRPRLLARQRCAFRIPHEACAGTLLLCANKITAFRRDFVLAGRVGLEPTRFNQCKGFPATWRLGKMRGNGRGLDSNVTPCYTACGFLDCNSDPKRLDLYHYRAMISVT